MQGILKASGGMMNSSFLAHNLLKAALIAAPIVLSVAPAQAGTRTVVIKGFTGAFAPANWFGTVNGNATATFDGDTKLTLTKTGDVSGQATRQITISQALVDSFAPNGNPNAVFIGGSFNFDWTFSGTPTTFSFNAIGPYQPSVNSPGPGVRNQLNTAQTNPESGTGPSPFFPAADLVGQTIGVQLFKNGGQNTPDVGQVEITNFTAIHEYEVPGPLPILGAGAAFAWSRKVRNRLKMSGSIA